MLSPDLAGGLSLSWGTSTSPFTVALQGEFEPIHPFLGRTQTPLALSLEYNLFLPRVGL